MKAKRSRLYKIQRDKANQERDKAVEERDKAIAELETHRKEIPFLQIVARHTAISDFEEALINTMASFSLSFKDSSLLAASRLQYNEASCYVHKAEAVEACIDIIRNTEI